MVVSPAYDQLAALLVLIHDRYQARHEPVAAGIAELLPTAKEALLSGNDTYITIAHGLLGMAVERELKSEKAE